MKKNMLMALVAAVMLAPVAARAEGPGPRAPDIESRVKVLTDRLGLTSDQQGKVKGILETKKTTMEGLSTQIKAANEKAHADIESVLTPEQKTKFAEMKGKARERRDDRQEKRKENRKERREKKK